MDNSVKKVSSLKNFIKIFLRIVVSLSLMIWLLSKADISQIGARWREVNWLLLILAPSILNLIAVALRSIRLRKLLNNFDMEAPIWWLSLIQMKGNFVKSFLPGGISGDIYRTFVIARKTGSHSDSIATILLEKVFGVASLLLLSLVSLFYGMYFIDYPTFRRLATPVLLISALFGATVIALIILIRIGDMDRICWPYRFWTKLQEIVEQFSIFFSRAGDIVAIFILSLLIQIAVVTWYFAISRAAELNLSFLIFMITIPLVELLLMLPISIGGLGIREGAFVILLAPFGLTIEDAVSFSLLTLVIFTIITILSGVAFLFEIDQRAHIIRRDVLKRRTH